MDKLPITLAVITLNEEQNLERCLRAADFCSEIVIVDSGSTDRTLEIAARWGARVVFREWSGYGDQKNFASELATQEWILCLDADEVVSPELRAEIHRRFGEAPACDAFALNRRGVYGDRLIRFAGWNPQWRLFLYRKGKVIWAGDEPHAVPVFRGTRKERLPGILYHYTYRDIRQHAQKTLAAAHASAVAMYRRGRTVSLCDLVCRPAWAFFRYYVLQLGVLEGLYGLVISSFACFYTFAKYAMLCEMVRAGKAKKKTPGDG